MGGQIYVAGTNKTSVGPRVNYPMLHLPSQAQNLAKRIIIRNKLLRNFSA